MGHENFLEILRGYEDFHQTLERRRNFSKILCYGRFYRNFNKIEFSPLSNEDSFHRVTYLKWQKKALPTIWCGFCSPGDRISSDEDSFSRPTYVTCQKKALPFIQCNIRVCVSMYAGLSNSSLALNLTSNVTWLMFTYLCTTINGTDRSQRC